jgi:WD40 repeat protein
LCLLEDQESLVSAGNDQTIRVWNTKTGQLARSLSNHTQAILGLAKRPSTENSKLPIIASFGADGTVRLWQPTIGRMVRFLRLSSSTPLALAWSSDGENLFLTQNQGELQRIDPDTLEILSSRKSAVRQPLSLVITQDGKQAVVGGMAGKVQKIELRKP